ncbi:MAG: hypothetical protein VKJ06_04020 [Vampirovibrionales bacterium]|nr:hypothetical protein [Vampirovibrionales bacterium]
MSDYIFKLKKGELELELKSDDSRFIEAQMDNWRTMLLSGMMNNNQQAPQNYQHMG